MLSLMRRQVSQNTQVVFVLIMAVVLYIGVVVVSGGTGAGQSLRNILIQAAILALVAAGQTIVIITAGIDLSVPWVISGSAILTALLSQGQNTALIWVIPVVLAIAGAVGLFNGLGVSVLKVHPIIMTLATNVILTGGVFLFVGIAAPSEAPEFLRFVAHGNILGVPNALLALLITLLVMTVLLHFTPFGRRLYAVGTSQTVSRFSGIQPISVLVPAYMLSSIAAAMAGMVFLGFVGLAYPGMGDRYLFVSIAAVIVGGASILGGNGHYFGTMAGALLITVVNVLLIIFNLGAGTINILYGIIILVSVWIASIQTGGEMVV